MTGDAGGVLRPVTSIGAEAGAGAADAYAGVGRIAADDAARVESAVDSVLDGGLRTADLGGNADTVSVTNAVLAAL